MRCTACDERLKAGDEYLPEAQGGVIHFACCGPERECFTKGDGEPLGPDDPIPTPDICGPRVKAAALVRRGEPCPPEVSDLWVAGAGYMICWSLITQRPIRRWSREAKARVRRRNLRQRLEKKIPLFADMVEAEELAARPAYYNAEDAA